MVTETHVDYKDVTHLNINKQQNLLKQKKNNVKIKEAKKNQTKLKQNTTNALLVSHISCCYSICYSLCC